MYLTHLRLINFRNHHRSEVAAARGLNIFVGANAQGKSSLLEAVFVAATGRSHRALRDVEMIALGETFARVRVAVQRGDREVEIDVGLRRDEPPDAGRRWKEMRVNGVPVRRGDLFGHLLCVMAAAHDGDTATGSPAYRRRLLDLLLVQVSPAYFYAAQRYARALLQRNRLLREHSGAALEAWDEQIATMGAAITVRRREMVERLARAARPVYRTLSGGREQVEMIYEPSMIGTEEREMAAAAREAMVRRRGVELLRGMTLVGPHRDDLRLRVDGRDLRLFGSRGQQLAVILAIRLAERQVLREETGEEPVLLLDDVLLTLDEERQGYLLEFIRGAQALVTVTTLATLSGIPRDAAVFRVTAGAVEAQGAHLA